VGFGVGIVDGDAMMMRRRRLRLRRRPRRSVPTRCLQRIQKGVGDVQHRRSSLLGI
jgi:hypothetical protein